MATPARKHNVASWGGHGLGFAADMRRHEQCAEVLLDLGLRAVRVISDNPAKIQALRQAGLKVVERVPLEVEPQCIRQLPQVQEGEDGPSRLECGLTNCDVF